MYLWGMKIQQMLKNLCAVWMERQEKMLMKLDTTYSPKWRMYIRTTSHQWSLPSKNIDSTQTIRLIFGGMLWRQYRQPTVQLLKDQELNIDWTDQAPAPEAVMELVCCGCMGQCCGLHCFCARSGMPCSHACLCEDSSCTNRSSKEDIDGDDNDSEEYCILMNFIIRRVILIMLIMECTHLKRFFIFQWV